jgi:hypothetical protein
MTPSIDHTVLLKDPASPIPKETHHFQDSSLLTSELFPYFLTFEISVRHYISFVDVDSMCGDGCNGSTVVMV